MVIVKVIMLELAVVATPVAFVRNNVFTPSVDAAVQPDAVKTPAVVTVGEPPMVNPVGAVQVVSPIIGEFVQKVKTIPFKEAMVVCTVAFTR